MTFIRTDILNPYNREILSKDHFDHLIDFLLEYFPEGFEKPTDISVNGNEIAVDDYDITLKDGDVIVLLDRTALPVGLIGGWFVTALANLAISVTLTYIANKLFTPDQHDAPQQQSPVYNLNNAQNSARYGSPIPIIYGTVRMFPSMIVQPFYRFEGNVEYLYHILCVGQGTNTTDEVLIGEDSITNQGDLAWKLLYQSDFYDIPKNAYGIHITKTLTVPSMLDLNAENGAESEKYTISADASKVEFDYTLPNGLFYVKSDGEYVPTTFSFTVKVYTLLGGIYLQVHSQTISNRTMTVDAIQRTVSLDLSAYNEPVYISFKRTYYYNHVRDTHNCYIKRVKAIYPNEDFTNLYGNVTLLACKIKATNTINSAGQVKVNGYFTRTDVGNKMHEVLTDIYTNSTYGGRLDASDLDFPVTTETVNCAYDSSMTIFDAMRKPALAQAYSVYLAGMNVILKKDAPNYVTSAMYNEMNILRNSLKVQYLFKEEYPAYDGYECKYIDGRGWIVKSEKYPELCSRPQVVDLFGVVDYGSGPIYPSVDSIPLLDTLNGSSMTDPAFMTIDGNVAYVASATSDSLTAVDISDPKNMVEMGTYTSASLNGATDVAVHNGVAYVVSYDADSITAIDVSNPTNMTELDSLTSVDLNGARRIMIYEGVAYVVATLASTLVSINISNPSALAIFQVFAHGEMGSPMDLDISNGAAFIACNNNYKGLVVVAVQSPTSMGFVSSFDHLYIDGAAAISISGTIAYMTSTYQNTLVAINIANPYSPSYIGSHISIYIAVSYDLIATANGYVFLTSHTGNTVIIYDVSNPTQPVSVIRFDNFLGAYGIAIKNATIYAISKTTGSISSLGTVVDNTTTATGMAEYLYKQEESRRKIVTFSTDIQGLVPQFLDKILISHNSLQWGEAGEVLSRSVDDLVISDPLEDTSPGKTIVFRNIDGSVSNPYDVTITDPTHITVVGAPAWVTTNIFYTIQDAGTAKEFLVTSVKPSGNDVQIECVNYDETIYNYGG